MKNKKGTLEAGSKINWLYAPKKGKKKGIYKAYTGTIVGFTKTFMIVKYHRKLIKFKLKRRGVKMFTHVRRCEDEKKLHISHLYHYVSAYQYTKEDCDDLVEQLEQALRKAKAKTEVVLVDKDGEMFFAVYPSGNISLCLRWKEYEVIRD